MCNCCSPAPGRPERERLVLVAPFSPLLLSGVTNFFLLASARIPRP